MSFSLVPSLSLSLYRLLSFFLPFSFILSPSSPLTSFLPLFILSITFSLSSRCTSFLPLYFSSFVPFCSFHRLSIPSSFLFFLFYIRSVVSFYSSSSCFLFFPSSSYPLLDSLFSVLYSFYFSIVFSLSFLQSHIPPLRSHNIVRSLCTSFISSCFY